MTIFHHPVVQHALIGALGGAGSAALVDFTAFRQWKTWHDAFVYDWGVATFRWFQGAVVGGVITAATAFGLNLT